MESTTLKSKTLNTPLNMVLNSYQIEENKYKTIGFTHFKSREDVGKNCFFSTAQYCNTINRHKSTWYFRKPELGDY